jgi:hypothetical protein
MIPLRETGAGVLFKIRVVPRASRAGVAGFQQDALKLRITDPPVEGQANEGCLRLLAGVLGVKRSQLAIVAGHASRSKTVAVAGVTAAALAAALGALAEGADGAARGVPT